MHTHTQTLDPAGFRSVARGAVFFTAFAGRTDGWLSQCQRALSLCDSTSPPPPPPASRPLFYRRCPLVRVIMAQSAAPGVTLACNLSSPPVARSLSSRTISASCSRINKQKKICLLLPPPPSSKLCELDILLVYTGVGFKLCSH